MPNCMHGIRKNMALGSSNSSMNLQPNSVNNFYEKAIYKTENNSVFFSPVRFQLLLSIVRLASLRAFQVSDLTRLLTPFNFFIRCLAFISARQLQGNKRRRQEKP